MSKRKNQQKHNLLIVSHPDDETLFFGGLLLTERGRPWHVVCVTDGNADGQGAKRFEQLRKACRALGVKKLFLFNLPDRFNSRLNNDLIKKKLSKLQTPAAVYTHGPLGEYGHPHHQDVSMSVHSFYNKVAPVYSVAHNCAPDKIIRLLPAKFKKKCDILSKIYFSETERFINFVAATATECYARVSLKEVESIYNFFVHDNITSPKYLDKYKWFKPYFASLKPRLKQRPF